MANLPCINSFDINLKHYTVVHECFENNCNQRISPRNFFFSRSNSADRSDFFFLRADYFSEARFDNNRSNKSLFKEGALNNTLHLQ